MNSKNANSNILKLLCLSQVCEIVGGKSRSTIYRWIAEGGFPKPVKVRGSSFWPEEIVAEWRESVIVGVAV